MNSGITTWGELPPPGGNVLLVVNSAPGDTTSVALAFGELERYAGSTALHVVAEPSWGPWLGARGLLDARVQLTADDNGQSVDLNHFLESPAGTLWIVPRQFRVIAGSSAHSLHNEEVKEIFEQRVCLLIGDGRFIAHALPRPYLAVLDLAALVKRLGRREKTEEYLGRCRSFVQDCHAAWFRQGSHTRSDGRPTLDMLELVGKHFGNQMLVFDECSLVPLGCSSESKDLETLGLYYRMVLYAHDETLTALYRERAQAVATRDAMLAELQANDTALLADLQAERTEAVAARDALLADLQAERTEAVAARDALLADLQAERNHAVSIRDGMLAELQAERRQAVDTRDAIIAGLRDQIDFLTHGWRRWVVKRRR